MTVFRTLMGKTLSHYRILEKIGAGGMGEVYRARDERLDREVAVKILPSGTLTDEGARKRFRKEALALSKFNHPNIATVYDFDTQAGVDFLVMEYVGGVRLEDKLAQGPLPEKEVLRLGQQLTEGLAAAHEQGVIHRDLKPGNLRVTSDGRLKILDFGLAKLLHPDPSRAGAVITESLTGTQGVTGTLPYMAPEQLRGEPVDARTDIYSTGVVLYEMATGRRPFLEKLATALADDILHKPAPPPGRLNPDLSSRLEEIIRKCLEKDPQHRYQSSRELLADFRRLSAPPSAQGPPPPSELPGERLDSWKEIESYLKRDIRTLRRWEKHEGLPVHRHLHEKKASVYAYKAELDAWWNNRRPKLEAEEAKEAKQKSKRWLLAGAVGAAVVVAAGVGYWWLAQAPVLPFAERDWVLIAQFENRTGEEVFDGPLEYALERELSNSRFVNVVPRDRINDALELMKKPPDATVDRSIGREICLRDGGIRTLITGRVEKLDTTYVLSAALVNPSNGMTVVSFSEEAVGQREVVPAIRRLSNRVRETLGEELVSIPQSEQKLEKVTTPSLRALQLFTQADAVIGLENNALAEELLRQAVAEDPEFTSGYMHLAYAVGNQGRPRKEWLPYAEKALKLSDRASERERYFIVASYYEMIEQPEKAMAAYDALLRLYPDHYWANANKRWLLNRQRRYQEANRYRVREAQLRPNSFISNLHIAAHLIRWGSRPFEAQPYVQRTLQLASPEADRNDAPSFAWLELFPAREHWLEGDLEKAVQEATRLSQQLGSRSGRERSLLAYNLGQFYLTLGKLQAAQELSQDPDARVAIAFARDNHPALRGSLRQALASGEEAVGPFEMILCARLGMLPEAEKALAIVEKRDFGAPWLMKNDIEQKNLTEGIRKVARGELGLARGRTGEALRLLEEGFNLIPPHGFTTYFLAAESLAQAYEQQGNLAQAVDVLRKAGEEKRRAVYFGGLSTLLWMRIQLRLADLYRNQGREGQAQEIEAELRKLLVYADPDHALLRQLKQSQEKPVAGSAR